MNNRYYWSFEEDADLWLNSGNTIKDCIEKARGSDECANVVYIGELETYSPYIDGSNVLDYVENHAYEELGEASEGWLDKTTNESEDELSDKLTNCLLDWLGKHDKLPRFGEIINVKAYDINTGKLIKEDR